MRGRTGFYLKEDEGKGGKDLEEYEMVGDGAGCLIEMVETR